MKAQFWALSSLALVLALFGSSQVQKTPGQIPAIPASNHSPISTPNSLVFTFQVPALQFTGEGAAAQPELDGYENGGAPGDPALPLKAYTIVLPPDVVPESVTAEVIAAKTAELDGTYTVAPTPPGTTWLDDKQVTLWGGNAASIVDGKNTLVYQNDAYFPLSQLNSLRFDQMRKWRMATLLLTPLQYNPLSGKLRLASEVTVQVSFEQAAPSDLRQRQIELSDTVMDGQAAEWFYNYDQARAWYPVMPRPAGLSTTFNYVIITSNAIVAGSTSLNNFIAHKQAQGYSVLVVTEDQYGGLTGQWPNRLAQKIRQWLKNNYLTLSIEYVLLIGDPTPYDPANPNAQVGDVPMRMCWPAHRYLDKDGKPLGQNIPSDYLYADLLGNWDLNTKGEIEEYCGELTDDVGTNGMNFSPEVYVGRIPVYKSMVNWQKKLDSILDKTIIYEDSGDLTWRKRALLPMSFSDANTDGAYLAEIMMSNYLNTAGYSSTTFYQHTAAGCTSTFASSQDLVSDAVGKHWKNHNYGIVTWWAHGAPSWTAIGYDGCKDGALLDAYDADNFNNSRPAIVFSASCQNGYPEKYYNLGYSLLKQGAVATISSTRNSIFGSGIFSPSRVHANNADLAYYVMERVVAGQTLGHALYYESWLMSLSSDWSADTNKPGNWLDFNLYGDPSLSIGDGHPTAPSAPSGLTATPSSASGINLSWTDTSDNELGFIVQRSAWSTGPWMPVGTLGINQTSYVNSPLSCGTRYYYNVQAYNAYGGAASSPPVEVWSQNSDAFENDNTYPNASAIYFSVGQTHSFSYPGDVDWVKFTATAGKAYNISTTDLGASINTVLELYNTNGTSLLASNNNCTSGNPASCINNWVAPADGVYYVKIFDWSNQGGCSGYTYKLAVQEVGWAAWPAQPTGLTATPVSHCQVDLAWTPNGVTALGFEIERFNFVDFGSGIGMLKWQQIATVGAGVTAYSNKGLECDKTYSYRVRAYNANGQSYYSNTADALTNSADTFEADNSYATAKTITPNGAAQERNFHVAGDVDWVKFTASVGQVYTITTSNLGAANDTVLQLYAPNGVTQMEWNDDCNGLAACITKWAPPASGDYYLRITNFYGQGGCPGYQYRLAVTKKSNPASLAHPTGVYFANTTVSSLMLSWPDANSGSGHGFQVERWQVITGTLGQWQQVGIAGPGLIYRSSAGSAAPEAPSDGNAGFTDLGLACNSAYTYRLRAFDALGESPYSDVITGTTQLTDGYEPDNDAPNAHLIAVNNPQEHNLGAGLDNDWVYFTATAGEVYTITTSQFTHRDAQTPAMTLYSTNGTRPQATASECSDMPRALCINGWTAPASDTYQVQVSGQGGCPGHDYLLTVADQHQSDAWPAPPIAFTATLTALDEITLHWTDNSANETGYDLERRLGNGWLQIADLGYGVTSYRDAGLACGLPYQYRVYAYNASGKSAYVTVDPITTPACVYHWPGENYLPLVVRR